MTKPTQLMPELLHIRAVIDEQWRIHGPNDNIVISRIEVERLIADNDRLREALEKIAGKEIRTEDGYYTGWKELARAALASRNLRVVPGG